MFLKWTLTQGAFKVRECCSEKWATPGPSSLQIHGPKKLQGMWVEKTQVSWCWSDTSKAILPWAWGASTWNRIFGRVITLASPPQFRCTLNTSKWGAGFWIVFKNPSINSLTAKPMEDKMSCIEGSSLGRDLGVLAYMWPCGNQCSAAFAPNTWVALEWIPSCKNLKTFENFRHLQILKSESEDNTIIKSPSNLQPVSLTSESGVSRICNLPPPLLCSFCGLFTSPSCKICHLSSSCTCVACRSCCSTRVVEIHQEALTCVSSSECSKYLEYLGTQVPSA